jgi:hypothetical protein
MIFDTRAASCRRVPIMNPGSAAMRTKPSISSAGRWQRCGSKRGSPSCASRSPARARTVGRDVASASASPNRPTMRRAQSARSGSPLSRHSIAAVAASSAAENCALATLPVPARARRNSRAERAACVA